MAPLLDPEPLPPELPPLDPLPLDPDEEPELLPLPELEPPPAASRPEASVEASAAPLSLIVQSLSSAGQPASTTGNANTTIATDFDARLIGSRR